MIQFDRKISIDGVAVIVAAFIAIFWLARLEGEVNSNSKSIETHEAKIDKLTDATVTLQQNMAVINAIQRQNERN